MIPIAIPATGFRIGTPDDLPRARKNLYNWQRKSQVLIKRLR
jgi:hypothetical protein